MKGKTLTNETARRAVQERRERPSYKLLEQDVAEVGFGENWDESLADAAADELRRKIEWLRRRRRQIDAFQFDSYACGPIHRILALPPNLAASDGFWRWLAVEKFEEVVEARHTTQNGPAHLGNYGIDARVERNRIALLWFRADLLYQADVDDPYHLASRPLHTDFVESGLIRPRYGWCRILARAMVRFQYRDPGSNRVYLHNDGIRELYKRLRRLHTTTAFEFLPEEELVSILEARSKDLRRT